MAGLSALSFLGLPQFANAQDMKSKLKGNINHSVCRWCYRGKSLEELCEVAVDIGIKSIDLLDPEEWPVVQKYGLTCAMSNCVPLSLTDGFNNPDLHAQLLKDYEALIPKAADAGLERIICFSGNRHGLSDEEGLENCAVGLEPVVKLAQKYGITICMELLNSKVNHPDYQCDTTPWGAALCEKLGSEHFKLLYDIYHMQIMEGDIIATIRKYHQYIGHYHTGGVPGRNEIEDSQELYYPAIMEAIVATGFKGYVAQEFIPTRDNVFDSLRKSIAICDV
ncbi:hydroxypyruvate isomerase [Marinoscillum furvescens DSM 4134]|uniref:Hydroxypyruvate isomerase n=2 Tax=Marinoscillum furvescens TaxID=1026 RepID=A0A3D9L4N2_MARFU|nr:hydroxypyruvate isomerase [Marinoscillum furvescens DSM 4134]